MPILQNKKLIGTLTVLLCSIYLAQAKTDIPVFLLSGQSNMSGYASANDLTTEQKQNVANVKIYTDMDWENNGKLRKWLTLGPGFGSSANNIGPELYIGRTLSEAMPNTKIALVKVCCGSTYLGKYSEKIPDCWIPPSSNNGSGGRWYKRMMDTAIVAAMKTFNTAYDTAQYTPRWAGFVWLQGEFDGNVKLLADAYETNLTYLINDIRKDLKVSDLPAIVVMIDAQSKWQFNSIIRAAEVAVTKKLKNVDTLDTKGFPTDGTHYKAQGQVKIGTIAAQRWIAMDFKYSPVVSVMHRELPLSSHLNTISQPRNIVFDLTGKMVSSTEKVNSQPSMNCGAYIIKNQNSHLQINLK